MTTYQFDDTVEAFTTNRGDSLDIDVVMPIHQAHSANVVRLPEEAHLLTGVDAIVTNQEGLRIGVKTADCTPILLYDPVQRAIAAIHSGWKGTLLNIIKAAVERMKRDFSSNPSDIRAAIGPCIQVGAFEVGPEVYELFLHKGYGAFATKYPSGKWHIDLSALCRQQLIEAGLSPSSIYLSPDCTFSDPTRYFSYRVMGAQLGRNRNLNCIMLRLQHHE